MDNKNKDLLGFTASERNNKDDYGLKGSQKKAFNAMKSGKNVFITGPAGTGKTFLIRSFTDWCNRHNKPLMLCAPTGMAAQEINGVTCHKAFNLDVKPIVEEKLGRPIKRLMETEVILIDEISMLRIDQFESIIKKVNQANSKRKNEVEKYMNGSDADREKIKNSEWKLTPIQIILVGDFYQLPPVIVKKDRKVLESAVGYKQEIKNGYAFQSDYWRSYGGNGFATYRLREIVRQQHDLPFTEALNQIRLGDEAGAKYILDHASNYPDKDAIWLYGTRKDVLNENNVQLNKLKGKAKTYTLKKEGKFADSEITVDIDLKLKVGARVMSLINDPFANRYVNGSLGTVTRMLKDLVTVQFDNGRTADMERYKWEVYSYEVKDGKLIQNLDGTYEQIPLKLAYAITIHKSQGKTFDAVNVSTKTFASGQLYVALSRVRSIENMYIAGDISDENLLVNEEVRKFDEKQGRYHFFKPGWGGSRTNSGPKTKKKNIDRGPVMHKRIPKKYNKQVDDYMDQLDEFDGKNCKTFVVSNKIAKEVKKYIAELKRENENLKENKQKIS